MKNNFNYEIFCDMDGVLVNFEDAAVDKINKELAKPNPPIKKVADKIKKELGRDYVLVSDLERNSPTKSKHVTSYMYKLLEDDEDFWANLPWQPGGKQLWSYIRQFDPDILTSPMDKAGKTESLSGKLIWVEKNLGLDADKVNFPLKDSVFPALSIGDVKISGSYLLI